MGVWIETKNRDEVRELLKSHPSWVCGLKHRNPNLDRMIANVTPFVGVWIETQNRSIYRKTDGGHTLRGCVDWNTLEELTKSSTASHTLRGCVDWNILCHSVGLECLCHTLRGCVDWNENLSSIFFVSDVSHPSWVCGLKLISMRVHVSSLASHPSWVCGLKP